MFLGAIILGFVTRMAFNRPTGLIPQSFDWGGNLLPLGRADAPAVPSLLMVLPQDRLPGPPAVTT